MSEVKAAAGRLGFVPPPGSLLGAVAALVLGRLPRVKGLKRRLI